VGLSFFFFLRWTEDLTRVFLVDVFKFDPNYLENKEKYKSIKAEILGEDSADESGSRSDDGGGSEEEEGHSCSLSALVHIVNSCLTSSSRGNKRKASRIGRKSTWSTCDVSSI
jgi:hypothetical protein